MDQLLDNLLHQAKLGFSFTLCLGELGFHREDLSLKLLCRSLQRLLPLSEHIRNLQRIIVVLFKFHFHLGEE